MNEQLYALAISNQKASQTVKKLLDNLSEEQKQKDRGSYYGALNGLYGHLTDSNRLFFNLLSAAFPEKNMGAYPMENACEPKEAEEADAKLTNFIKTASEEDLTRTTDFFGRQIDVHSLILKWIMHSTHHRGQISQIFDEEKIEHDWIAG